MTAQRILKKNPNVLFAIAGSGEEQEQLKKLAAELGITASVRWLGWQREMNNLYKSLDVLLFNSDWDALPTTPLEAMSFGVPTVCSLIHGGLGEILDSREVGFLYPAHDIDVLGDRVLLKLLGHQEEARSVGLAGRAHIQNVCRPEPIVEWHAEALFGTISSAHTASSAGRRKKKRTGDYFPPGGALPFRARACRRPENRNATLVEIFKSDNVYGGTWFPGANGFHRVTRCLKKIRETNNELVHGIQTALD